MRISPSRHEIEFGEGLTWLPPALAASFYVFDKTPAFSRADDSGTAGGAAPRWVQVAGFDIAGDVPIDITGQETTFSLSARGVTATWAIVAAAFDGFDPELAMITALDADGLVLTIDRYSMPNPESSAAATIAAQERAYLQSLLNVRSALAGTGHARVSSPDGTEVERMDIAVFDRRVAECRARIAWFEQAAAGNAIPRGEFW